MTDIEDTQQLHNTFVEPLQVETSNSTTNSNCAKLSPEEISTGNQEPYKEKTLDEYRKEGLDGHLIAGINFVRQLNAFVNKWY